MKQIVTKLLLFAVVVAVPAPLIASIFIPKGDVDPKSKLKDDPEFKVDPKFKDDPKFKVDPKFKDDPKFKVDPKFKDDPKFKVDPKFKDDPKRKSKEAPKPKVVPVEPLGEDLAELLRQHPKIRLAEAKLALAEVEVQHVRAEVIRQALALKFKVEQAELAMQRAAQMAPNFDMGELHKARLMYEQARQEYRAFIQAVPRSPARPINPLPPPPPSPPMPPARPPQPNDFPEEILPPPPGQQVNEQTFERVQIFLAAKMTFEEPGEIALAELLNQFNRKLPAASRLTLSILGEVRDTGVAIPAGQYTGRGLLQLITDQHPGVRVLVRQYGLLVTWHDRAPDNAMSWDMVPPRDNE